ncbi:Homoserine O-succinyltransferase [Slackia heliotrinireducens]|uniref:Homoserine O-acetyltransferase n=1 Tax=Slackia heliotrinireducens (strain ATCC 29202 / DSM 20476 / NCTC 11029 / RHS 1) TaxID=471855 RepID=C7N6I7_SLAHD|nr:homoserine O-succinyltransferase [Slackia heliotrinireducens]ACV22522.1 homoserine O-succinyltransferase [Slackia heliotrinireducens DSM 20476]VEH00959.1 Homoserine O-succinyltransferase [Slackia heliotrinireducens]
MPIRIPDALPATAILEKENIFVMTEHRAMHQDIRPLRVLILNLMPTKIVTETQLMRRLSNTPLQVEIDLLRTATHASAHVSANHLESFYKTFDDVKDYRYDGMIITGAPVEKFDYEDVDYWDEYVTILDWAVDHVHSIYHICWAAQAALYHLYGVPKYLTDKKIFGVFPQRLLKSSSPLVRGFNDISYSPQSRHATCRYEDIVEHQELEVIAYSDEIGPTIVKSTNSKHFFVFGHPEYDRDTLKLEYDRDVAAGKPIEIPVNYYPDDDPEQRPVVTWRAEGQLIYSNWLNYYVYQTTPYDLTKI